MIRNQIRASAVHVINHRSFRRQSVDVPKSSQMSCTPNVSSKSCNSYWTPSTDEAVIKSSKPVAAFWSPGPRFAVGKPTRKLLSFTSGSSNWQFVGVVEFDVAASLLHKGCAPTHTEGCTTKMHRKYVSSQKKKLIKKSAEQQPSIPEPNTCRTWSTRTTLFWVFVADRHRHLQHHWNRGECPNWQQPDVLHTCCPVV